VRNKGNFLDFYVRRTLNVTTIYIGVGKPTLFSFQLAYI
jgi:hypothetical protein